MYVKQVHVVTKLTGNGVEERFDKIDGADRVDITDGHLVIRDDDGVVIAAYAPGDWKRAKRKTDAS